MKRNLRPYYQTVGAEQSRVTPISFGLQKKYEMYLCIFSFYVVSFFIVRICILLNMITVCIYR